MTSYVSPYTGQLISPSQVGYESLSITVDTILQWPVNGNSADVVANIIEVSASSDGLSLIMPPATEVSDGQSVLIRNIGTHTVNIKNSGLGAITTVSPGIAIYIYLTDNTTVNGTWSNVTFGAGTSSADAATLAGFGLTAIGNTLNESTPVSLFSSNYTLTTTDRASLYAWTGGAGTVTLPVAQTVGAGWYVTIKNDGSGILNIAPQGTNMIDVTFTAWQLQIQESLVLATDGLNWYTYAYGKSAVFAFTQLYLVVTGGTVTLTDAQASNIIQEYAGTLTSNCTIILPSTVQFYSFRNITTGPYTLTFKTSAVGGTTIVLPQNQTIIAICDGTNVYNAQTSTSSFIQDLTLGNGSASAPSLSFQGDALTGLYLAASGQLDFAIAGVAAGQLTANGLLLPVGINGGAF